MEARRRRPPLAALHDTLRQAQAFLAGAPPSDEAIHEARRALKRSRALLRLMRPALDAREYREQNRVLRDAARELADARDAKVSSATLDALVGEPLPGGLAGPRLRALRQELRERHQTAVRPERLARARDASLARIQAAIAATDAWQNIDPGDDVVRAGLERMYRAARRTARRAAREPTDGALHELRKQVKYLRDGLDFLASAHPRRMARTRKRAERIASLLGDERDLAVLGRRAGEYAGKALLNDLRGRRGKLQRRALKRARRLLARKPRRFVVRLTGPLRGPRRSAARGSAR